MKKITSIILLFLLLLGSFGSAFSQISIGTANNGTASNSSPITLYYGNSYSQTIYLASEIGTSGNITSLSYQLNPGSTIANSDEMVDVWIGHTAKTTFTSTTDWVAVSSLTRVLTSGTITKVADVLTITFSTPFAYNGTDNLIVAVDANEGADDGSSSFIKQTTGPLNTTLLYRSDSANADPTAPPTATFRQALRGNITINGLTVACPKPTTLVLNNRTTTSANIGWTAGGTETAWEYVVQAAGLPAPTGSGTPTSTNPLNLTGLTLNTAYDFYVRADCGRDQSTYAGPLNFFTGYCIPSGASSTATYIDDFATTGGSTTNITNNATGYGTGGYQDFYNTMSVTSFATGSFSFTTTTVGNTLGAAVWVDFNKNLVFEASERVFNTTTYVSNPGGSITIPAGTAVGDYTMRVKVDYNSSNPTTPCAVGRGEVEDYKLTVTAAPSCNQPSNAVISAITANSATATWDSGIVTAVYNWKVVASGAGPTGTAIASGNTANLTTPITGLTASTAYDFYVKADCLPDFVGPTPFTTAALPPANDQCINALTITASADDTCANKVTGTTEGASITAPNVCGTSSGKDVWYAFTPSATGNYLTQVTEITDSGSNSTYVSVFSGACGTLTQVGTGCSNTSIIVPLTSGTAYLINVRSTSTTISSFVTFDLCIRQIIPPSNDDCANATSLTVGNDLNCTNPVSGTTIGSTQSLPGCSGTANDDVWYSFTATNDKHSIIITNTSGSTDIVTQVFDSCGGTSIKCQDTPDSPINLTGLTSGNTYYFRIYTYSSIASVNTSFTVCVGTPPPPPPLPANDEFANATTLTVGTNCNIISGTLLGATNSSESLAAACGSTDGSERDVWYQFVAPANGNINIQTSVATTGNLDTVMVVYAPDGITQIDCNDDLGTSASFSGVSLTGLMSGLTYFVEIHEYDDDATGTFNICAFSPQCGGITTTWGGSSWTPSTPTSADVAIINGTYTTATSGNFNACALIVNSGRTLNVSAGGFVKVENDITVAGTLNVVHTGSVVQVNDASTTVKTGTITVRKTTPTLAARAFMIMSSPMSAETRTGVYGTLINVQKNFPANFVPNPAVAAAFPLANNFADDNGDDWQVYTAGPLTPGVGNLVIPQTTPQGSGSANLNYTLGTLNSGLVTVPLQYNGSQNASPNMLGNPYASAIDADVLYTVNSAPSAKFDLVYFWEHLTAPSASYPGYNGANYNMGDISQYNPVSGVGMPAANGGATPTKYIASGQGFAVKALAAGTSVSFNNSMRVTDNNNTYRRGGNMELLYVNIMNEKYSLASTTAIHFSENATNGFDVGYDNARMATPVSIYGQMETGEELGIQSRAAFSEDDKVSLGFSTQVEASETYTVSLKDLEGEALTNATVFLLDNENGNFTNLSESSYNFTSEAGTFPSRFTVMFRNPFLGVNGNAILAVGLYPNPAKEIVTIASPNALITNVTIVDISGRIIENVRVNSQNTYQLNIASLESAVYFVNVTTESGQVTKRLIKN